MKSIWSLGLMTGTSFDGIDAAMIKTDGVDVQEWGPALGIKYNHEFRAKLRSILGCDSYTPQVKEIEEELTRLHADVANQLIEMAQIKPELVGFHGQTIFHKSRSGPVSARTFQIGNGQLLAQLLKTDVVFDFRSQDTYGGGEGAPLVPIFHQSLCKDLPKPIVVLNIGGVSNITWLGPSGELVAFDTGPGGALMDDFTSLRTGASYDKGGNLARSGRVDEAILRKWVRNPFFAQGYPKSLDRNTFELYLNDLRPLSTEDGLALLCHLTARSIDLALKLLPEYPRKMLLCGGGRHNSFLKKKIEEFVSPCVVQDCDEIGWQGDNLEAQAFAFLAVRSKARLPLTFPLTTGVSQPSLGGSYRAYVP